MYSCNSQNSPPGPGVPTPSPDPTGVLGRGGSRVRASGVLISAEKTIFSAPQAKKFLRLEVPNQRFSLVFERGVKLYRMLRNAANADICTHSWRSESTACGVLLLLLPLLLLLVCQQPCSRASGTHRRPKTTRIELERRFRDVLRACSPCGAVRFAALARRVLRVSALGRRVAAAYGNAFWL